MIAAAERVVTDLTTGRRHEKESDPVGEVQALHKLLGCAKEMREACDAVFDNERLRRALKFPLLTGVIRHLDRNKHSEEDIRKVFKNVVSSDYFDKFGKRLVIDLDRTIKATSFLVDAMEDATKIKDPADYLYTTMLAYRWLEILGVRPTSMNFDKSDEGITTFEPTLFQDFVTALPLDDAIKAETVRTAVAFIRKWSLKELKTR